MRSVWICSRNDAIANVAVVLAALGVFGTGTGWPDVVVAAVIAGLSLWGAAQIIRQARAELRDLAASGRPATMAVERSEEHTSELQSLMRISYAVFCLKKTKTTTTNPLYYSN